MEIDRRSCAFRTVALDRFADRDAERREPHNDGVTIELPNAEAQMIHVSRRHVRIIRNEVEQRGACTHLHKAERVDTPLLLEAQRLFLELHHAGEIAHAQHDMVDAFDFEGHGE